MKVEKVYDYDRVATEWATHYVNNNVEFGKFTIQQKAEIIDDIKNLMVNLCIFYEAK